MGALRYMLAIMIGLIINSCSKTPGDYKPFSDFDFQSGEYRLYGFISEEAVSDFSNLHKDFYIESISVLDLIKNSWIFDSTNKRMPCGWEYELCLVHHDHIVMELRVNSECKYLISNAWYEFNPNLWNQIPTDKIIHLDRDEAWKIREKLFHLKEKNSPKAGDSTSNDETTIDTTNFNFQQFWITFRQAVIDNDTIEIIQHTNFPFKTRGPQDSDPIIQYNRKDFIRVFMKYLNQDSGMGVSDETQFDIIRNIEFISKSEDRYYTVVDNWVRIGDMEFVLSDNEWKLTFLYLLK